MKKIIPAAAIIEVLVEENVFILAIFVLMISVFEKRSHFSKPLSGLPNGFTFEDRPILQLVIHFPVFFLCSLFAL